MHDTMVDIPADHVGVYVCGATVYDDAHVGHARSAIVFDVLRRHLEHGGTEVKFVQNFTDIDDKILERAAASGCDPAELAEDYIRRYNEDSEALNIMRPSISPKATEHISEMIEMIRTLVESGAAYATEHGVYFDVSGFKEYGKLSGKNTDELVAGARVAVDETKRSALDFALWKGGESARSWDSPWGPGRPGWHIECSAMSAKYLDTIDIHGGGRDLIFPHHENEIAQSESCSSHELARAWMHVGMVTMRGEKMSKSTGNSKTVRDAIGKWGANTLRIFCLAAHYTKRIDYEDDILGECATRWQQAETCYYELRHAGVETSSHSDNSYWKKFADSLDDDLDTRSALDALSGLCSAINEMMSKGTSTDASASRGALESMLDVLGLRIKRVTNDMEKTLDNLADKREALRADSKYAESDEIRDEMKQLGATVLDHGSKTVWVIRDI